MGEAPVGQGLQHSQQTSTALGQLVHEAAPIVGIAGARDEPCALEPPKSVRQHMAGDEIAVVAL